LAGILAPQLNEIGAAPRGGTPVVDTSVGNLLSNVGSALGALGRGGGGPSITQADRDDAALRPAFAEMQKLIKQRDSGAITPAAFSIKARSLNKATIANFPHLRTTISEGFATISGEELLPIAPDVAQEFAESTLQFILDDAEGRTRMGEAMRYSADGTIDNQRTLTAMGALVGDIQAKRARAADIKADIDELKARNEFSNQKQAEMIDPLLRDMSIAAGVGISKITENFVFGTDTSSLDATAVLSGLAVARADYEQIFTRQAAEMGVVDEERFRSGLSRVMAPFDRQIQAFTIIAGNKELVTSIMAADNKKQVIEVLNSVGMFAGPASEEILALNMAAQSTAELATAIPNLRKRLMNSSTKNETKGDVTVVEDGSLTEAAAATVSTLSQQDRVDDIKGNLDGWDTITTTDDDVLSSRDNRNFLVQKFNLATGIIDTTGAPVTEDTFDRIYPPSFIKQYNRVVAFDDDVAMGFKSTVTRNLSNILDRRMNVVNGIITNDFQTAFPSMGVEWDGSNFVLALSGETSTSAERNLVNALDMLNLPLTLEGIEELGRAVRREQIGVAPSGLDPKDVRTFESTTININLDSFTKLKEGVRFLNKVSNIAELFPDDVKTTILPSKVGFSAGVVIVNSTQELQNLEPGTKYLIKGMPRSRTPFVRGDEIISQDQTPDTPERGPS
jgi:hypothetical protein